MAKACLPDLRAVARACGLGLALVLAGCATPPPPHVPVPADLVARADLPGFAGLRFTGIEGFARLEAEVGRAISSAQPGGHEIALLALSSGGERGAFGAGVLAGWTQRGDRPTFQVVCGVSAGALIAPFAFAGPEMDGRMREAFTRLGNQDVFRLRSMFSLIEADSLATTGPLLDTLLRLIDDECLRAIARAHAAGRRLYVLTTDFDSVRPVVWDMGAIAASGRPEAADLFRRVLMASTAVPVAFQPQYFGVEVDGRRFDEMHCDGGLMTQVFMPLPAEVRPSVDLPVRVYLVMNGSIEIGPLAGPPRLLPLVTRTYQVMLRTQSLADLRRIRRAVDEAGCEFRVASIPGNGEVDMEDGARRPGFDPDFMGQLFELGRSIGRRTDGFAVELPPGLETVE